MAGGIDWFRWHHGSVSDQKFILIARKSGASVAEVIAVWACLLEAASASDQRGNFGPLDYESMDCALGMDDGRSKAIHEAMAARGVVTPGGDVCAWGKRQPRREDDTAAERKRRQREREHEIAMAAAVTPDKSRNVTQRPAEVTHGHDRGEERREEEIQIPPIPLTGDAPPTKPKASKPPQCPDGVEAQVWADWLTLRRAKKAPVTETAVASAQAEASKAGMTLEAFLRVWCARGSQGLQAEWLRPDERQQPRASPVALVAQENPDIARSEAWRKDHAQRGSAAPPAFFDAVKRLKAGGGP